MFWELYQWVYMSKTVFVCARSLSFIGGTNQTSETSSVSDGAKCYEVHGHRESQSVEEGGDILNYMVTEGFIDKGMIGGKLRKWNAMKGDQEGKPEGSKE